VTHNGDKPAGVREVKPSFTFRYFLFFALTTSLASSIAFFAPRFWEQGTQEEKNLLIATYPSPNFIELPEHLTGQFEFFQSVPNSDKRPIKSLFGYRVSVTNRSQTPVDDVTLYLYPPRGVELVEPPQLRGTSRALMTSAVNSRKGLDGGGVSFVLDLLGSKESVTFAYVGLSPHLVEGPTYLSPEARKKGWRIGYFEAGYDPDTFLWGSPSAYTDYSEPIRTKRLGDYTLGEAVELLLLFLLMCCLVAMVLWMLFRIWPAWEVIINKLLKRSSKT
jgi:hypothetical protein